MNPFIEKYQQSIIKIITAVGVLLAAFLFVATLGKLKEYRFIGSGLSAGQTITVSGKGEVNRSPDTAKVQFSVRAEHKVLKTAQDEASGKISAVTEALKKLGIEEKHIKTDAYNSYPKYEYNEIVCYGIGCPRPGTPKLLGYEVSHSITVNVKNLDLVEEVLGALGAAGVSDISGPNFGFEDDEAVAREARDLAIADARAQAKSLAKSLGVRLVRLVAFSEGGVSYPMRAEAIMAKDAIGMGGDPAPTIPVGEHEIASQVTLVYEIR